MLTARQAAAVLGLGALLSWGCDGDDPSRDGGARDAATCAGDRPIGCAVIDTARDCCREVEARCLPDGTWDCPNPADMMFACEGFCGSSGSCSNPEPNCYEDLGDGCCGDAVPAFCAPPAFSCGAGNLEERDCVAMAPACGG